MSSDNMVLLMAAFAALLSLAARYVPGFSTWFESLETSMKQLFMAGVLLLAAVVMFVGSCTNLWITVVCSSAGAKELVSLYLTAIVTNQATYLLTKK